MKRVLIILVLVLMPSLAMSFGFGGNGGGVSPAAFGNEVSDFRFSTLTEALTAATGKNLIITKKWDLTALTITEPGSITVMPGGGFNNSGTLAINVPVHLPLSRVFYGSGAVTGLPFAYCEWWGGKGDGLDASAALNTTAIHFALGASKTVLFQAGNYVHTGITLLNTNSATVIKGVGKRTSRLTCNTPSAHNISLINEGATSLNNITISDIGITGNNTNGDGIHIDGIYWFTFERLYVDHNGGHGINIYTTSNYLLGDYVGTIKDSNISFNSLDGASCVSESGLSTRNSITFSDNEFNGNTNGLSIWGTSIRVVNNTIEANNQFGIKITKPTDIAKTAYNITIEGNYFENNAYGHFDIITNVTGIGIISGLAIRDNWGLQDTTTIGAAYKSFSVSGGYDDLRSFVYSNNNFITAPTASNVIADFGNTPASNSIIQLPAFNSGSSLTAFDTSVSQYINFGKAMVHALKSKTLQGYFYAKGGTGITWANPSESDNITVSGSDTYMPLCLSLLEYIDNIYIPVRTDAVDFDVAIKVYSKGKDVNTAHTNFVGFHKTVTSNSTTTTQLLNLGGYLNYVLSSRIQQSNIDNIIYIKITLTTPGTYFYIGNPTIWYH